MGWEDARSGQAHAVPHSGESEMGGGQIGLRPVYAASGSIGPVGENHLQPHRTAAAPMTYASCSSSGRGKKVGER